MSKTADKKLQELKSLIRQFFKEIECVPFRAVDCDQQRVNKLIEKLEKALVEK